MDYYKDGLFAQLWIVDGLNGEICIPVEIVELIYKALWTWVPSPLSRFPCAKISYNKTHHAHLHPLLGPASVWYYDNGNIGQAEYMWNGRRDREGDKPSIIMFDYNGNIESERYFENDKLNRQNGPAIIFYLPNGNVKRQIYYIEGRKINPQTMFSFEQAIPTSSANFI